MKENISTTSGDKEINFSYTPPEKIISSEEQGEQLKKENIRLSNELDETNKLLKIIAHDLRNPIGTQMEFLREYKDCIDEYTKEELHEGIKKMFDLSEASYNLVIKLLEYTQDIKDGKNYEASPANVKEQIDEAVKPLLEIAKQKKITYELSIDTKNIDIEKNNFSTNPMMFQTIIRNLFSNAIKFTNNGGNIFINCEKNNNELLISIKDDGVGLSDEDKEKLFNMMGKSKSGTNNEKGSGLGLSFCKDNSKKMGGDLRVESKGEGQGTTFILTLPIEEKSKE